MTPPRSDTVVVSYATIEDPRPTPTSAEVFCPAWSGRGVREKPVRQMNRHERRRAAAIKRRKR